MNRRTILVASIILFSVLGLTVPQVYAVRSQRSLITGEVIVAGVTDSPPADMKTANGKLILSTITFDESQRVTANIYFYIPEDDIRVTIKLVSVISVSISKDEAFIEGYWDVRENSQLVLNDELGQFSTTINTPTYWGLDIAYSCVRVKGLTTSYKLG